MAGLTEYVPGSIWLEPYPVRYAGCDFDARMTVLRLSDGRLMIHSPSAIDASTKEAIEALGTVAFVVAPGNFHHFHVPSCQKAFPAARTFVCPGIERKRPDIRFDGTLGDEPDPAWAGDLDQVLVGGHRLISEVAFLHRASKTLVLVDLIENIGDRTLNTSWLLRFFWKYVTFMWNVTSSVKGHVGPATLSPVVRRPRAGPYSRAAPPATTRRGSAVPPPGFG